MALTGKEAPRQRKRQAWQAVAVAFLVIVSFALFGWQLLAHLHISLPALQCAGGLTAGQCSPR